MKAIVLDAFGDNTQLHVRQLPDPVPAPGQVLLRVGAAGIAIWDAMVRDGKFPLPMKPPLTPGFEGAGVVEAVGAGVDAWKPSDAVWTFSYGSSGLWAEKAVVPAADCARKPGSYDFAETCGLGVAAVTAYMAIVEALAVTRGETLLIAGAAGGVGTIAVQLAKHIGARVIATGGPDSAEYARSLGADEYVDYTRGEVVAEVRALAPSGVDAAFDAVNGTNARETVRAVRGGGRVAIVTLPEPEPEDRSIRVTRIEAEPKPERLAAITEFADAGVLKVQIDRRFTLPTIPDGLTYVERRHTRGKVVAEF
jgi:NADPH:quinone reductase-like Zn-dependent oxidoreductase